MNILCSFDDCRYLSRSFRDGRNTMLFSILKLNFGI